MLFMGCQSGQESSEALLISPGANAQTEIQRALIMAQPGDTIRLAEGRFELQNVLTVDGQEGFVLMGAGMDKTILSFAEQTDGAEGLNFAGKNYTLQDFTVEDTKGDAIKVRDSDGVIIRNIKVTWTRGPHEENGAYGLYPVTSRNVLMEGCEAYHASDAGIYVGQSYQVIVRNNRAERNVAGIEIENSDDVEVYDNIATGNTGGLMIFDLPNIPKTNGSRIVAYRNQVYENNHPNFGQIGNTVAMVPAGVGFMIMAYRDVEAYDNDIRDNQTVNAVILSYLATGLPLTDENYDPFNTNISFHNNRISRTRASKPDMDKDMGQLIAQVFAGDIPDIVFDGVFKPGTEGTICLQNNGEATVGTMDAANAFANPRRNPAELNCTINPVQVAAPNHIQ